MKRAVKEVLKFEVIFKLITLALVNPLLNEIYQTYVSSKGVSFNKDIIGTFMSVKGALIFLSLFFLAAIYVFYELSVVINLVMLCIQKETFTVRQVMVNSLWNLRALRGSSLVFSSLYYLLLLPLISMVYLNSLVPGIEIPEFILSEMQRTRPGIAGGVAMNMAFYALYFLLFFVPVSMVLRQQGWKLAAADSVKWLRRLEWHNRLRILVCVGGWFMVRHMLTNQWRRNRLKNKDFDIYFYKYLVYSQAFRKDFLFWIFEAVLFSAAMGICIYIIITCIMSYEKLHAEVSPVWEGDSGIIVRIVKKRWLQWKEGWRKRIRKKRYRMAGALLCLAFIAYAASNFYQIPLRDKPFVIGHRGSIYGIENTVKAVEEADKIGADYAEIDVQLTKDGVPVVVHDSNLWRLAKKPVNVRDLTLDEIKALKVSDFSHKNETAKIPTLEEMLSAAKKAPNRIGFLIELKVSGEERDELSAAVVRLVEQYDFGERAMFMSLDYLSVLSVKQAHPEWWTGYCIFGSSGEIDDTMLWKYEIDFIAAEENQVSNRLVTQARERGLPVYVWTVFDTVRMKQYLEMGVTGLIGDAPDDIKEVVEEYNQKNGTSMYEWQGDGYPKGE